MEALLRWRHPEHGIIPPLQFIPQLEEMGLMVEVGSWVLETACRQNAEWQQQGLPPVRVAVNLSPQQFYRDDIVDTVESVLRTTGLDPQWLELELTESLTLDDTEATIQIMSDLKSLGVSLSLDDFGTGWSSLSYLRRFHLDRIKIDRSFLRDIASQPAAEAIVRTIITLGRNLGLTCVAEGVETREQLDYLQKQKCGGDPGILLQSRPPRRRMRNSAAFDAVGYSLVPRRSLRGQQPAGANRGSGPDPLLSALPAPQKAPLRTRACVGSHAKLSSGGFVGDLVPKALGGVTL
jgi:EAL domain-containing protein (putative c-di-GMP-specific phosphodiesterase class I)